MKHKSTLFRSHFILLGVQIPFRVILNDVLGCLRLKVCIVAKLQGHAKYCVCVNQIKAELRNHVQTVMPEIRLGASTTNIFCKVGRAIRVMDQFQPGLNMFFCV